MTHPPGRSAIVQRRERIRTADPVQRDRRAADTRRSPKLPVPRLYVVGERADPPARRSKRSPKSALFDAAANRRSLDATASRTSQGEVGGESAHEPGVAPATPV